MALSSKPVPFFLLLVLIFSVHIEARASQFLTNFAPELEPQPPILAPSISLAPAPMEAGFGYGPALAPAPAPVEGGTGYAPGPVESSDNPYGLYSEFSSRETTTATATATTTTSNEEDENASERLGEYNAGNQYYNNNNYNNNNERYSNNYYYSNGYENNNNNNYEQEQQQRQGMSDTRFLENGKYFYDVNYSAKKMNNGYEEAAKENSYTEGSYGGYGEKSKYEFDSMEEYERQQGYPDTDKLFNP